MQYRADLKLGNKLSILGYGCMRLPRGLSGKIDIEKAEALVLSAIEKGVNYFDTAYIYGGSEQVLGTIFERNEGIREKIYLATKLPLYQCKTYDDFDRLFYEQLERLHTDHVDYYLIHNISSVEGFERIRALGIEKWIAGKKAEGKIHSIGFSFHGIQKEFLELLDEYDWDFCQIQYNYVNVHYQAGRLGLLKAHEKGLSVIIMEPLLGGKLAVGLPKMAESLFKDADASLTPAAWALLWLWNHKEVTVVLSGMNAMSQLEDNVRSAETAKIDMFSEKEKATIDKVVSVFQAANKIPCTGCNYCLPCPKGVNIPGSFAAYNISYTSGFVAGMTQYMTGIGATNPEKNFSARKCVQCGRCEKLCPQHIEIIKSLQTVLKRMEPGWVRAIMKLFNRIQSK